MNAYQIVILEVQTNTWKVDKRLYASLAERLWVTDTRALKNERRAEGASRHDDLLPSLEGAAMVLGRRERFGWNSPDADGAAAFDDHLVDLGVHGKMQVLVDRTGAVDVSVG